MTYIFTSLLFGVWYYFHNASSLIICRLNIKIDYLEKRIEDLETENKKKTREIETGKIVMEQRLMKCEDAKKVGVSQDTPAPAFVNNEICKPVLPTIVDELVIVSDEDVNKPQPKKRWLW